MRTTAHSSWGAPCQGTRKTLVRADGLKLPLRVEILELVALLIDETERRGYDVKPGQTWGYACRRIAGSSSWSNHAWGLAVDINAPSNPMTTRLVTDMPSWMPALWKSYGFRWGGDYSRKKDAMHYEFMGSVADAAAQTVKARKAFGGGPTPAPAPGTTPAWAGPMGKRPNPLGAAPGQTFLYSKELFAGKRDGNTYWIQWVIDQRTNYSGPMKPDGFYGQLTHEAVWGFQGAQGLKQDGKVGRITWDALNRFA